MDADGLTLGEIEALGETLGLMLGLIEGLGTTSSHSILM